MQNKVLVSYVPSIHSGYLKFFRKHQGSVLYILGSDFIGEFKHLGRDIRALAPIEVQSIVEGLGIFSSVHVLDKVTLKDVLTDGITIVMPDEDVTRKIHEEYFKDADIAFENIFLRWDMSNVTKKWDVSYDDEISVTQLDEDFMLEASFIAERSPDFWRQVGIVIVKDGKVLFSGYNKPEPSEQTLNTLGDPRGNFGPGERIDLSAVGHSEMMGISFAACKGIALEGARIYVTTFPCPTCAMGIANAGIKRVYYAEGYSLIHGEDSLRKKKVEIIHVDLNKLN